jgi:hypothetical protein
MQPKVTVTLPVITRANILHNSDGYKRDGQRKSLVTLTAFFRTFAYVCFTVQWPYSTCRLHIATIMMWVSSIPPDCLTRASEQGSQQQTTRRFTKISQQENANFHTNIKAVIWVTKYKQYKQTFQSYVLPQIILISRTSPGTFFFIAKQP